MQKKVKSQRNSIIFVTTCFLIFGLSLTYFFVDLNKTSLRSDKEIATVIFKKKIAQRKFSDSVIWERLQNKSFLYNEDIIRTENDSQTTIIFNNGTSIDLDEKTMIQIFEGKNGELKFNVSGGKFAVDTTEAKGNVSVDLGNGAVINLEKGTKISADSSQGKNSFSIQQGNANILKADGTEEVILSGDSIKIDENGLTKKFPVAVSNLNITQKIVNFTDENQLVTLDLKRTPVNLNQKIVVETSTDSSFENILERKEITDVSINSVDVKVVAPTVFYRIFAEDEEQDVFEGKLLVEMIKTPEIISPVDGSVFVSKNTLPDVFFSWNCGEYCDYVKLSVFDNSNPDKPVIEQEVSGRSVSINKFEEGKYSWSIIPHYTLNDIGFGKSTKAINFEVNNQPVNEKPELKIPQNETVLQLENELKDVVFMWKSDVVKSKYLLEISSDENFVNLVYKNQNENTRDIIPFDLNKIQPKKYFWRVTRIDDKNKKFVSDTRNFEVRKYIPSETELVFPPDNYGAEINIVSQTQFLWKLSDSIDKKTAENIFEISDDKDFDNIVKQITTDKTSCSDINLSDGNYFWRVVVKNKENGNEIVKTESRSISVLSKLEKPLIQIPLNKSVHNIADFKVLKIVWNEVEAADFYKVRIFDPKTNIVISENDYVKENKLNTKLDNVSLDSDYICSVTAFSEEKENRPSRVSLPDTVNISFENAKKIVLQSPVNGAKLNGLAALKEGVIFKWNTDKSQKTSEFILTKVNSNGTSKNIFSSSKVNNTIKVPQLSEGNYKWTVRAQSKNGTDLTPDLSFTFTVLKREPLKSPVLQVPSSEYVITSDYLKNNRQINFKWDEISGATDYVFVLYQVNKNGSLKKIVQKNLTKTDYIFTDLKSLDVGEFEWHVTAYSHLKNGFEEQKSEVSVSKFKIDILLPGQIQTLEPGRMYGN